MLLAQKVRWVSIACSLPLRPDAKSLNCYSFVPLNKFLYNSRKLPSRYILKKLPSVSTREDIVLLLRNNIIECVITTRLYSEMPKKSSAHEKLISVGKGIVLAIIYHSILGTLLHNKQPAHERRTLDFQESSAFLSRTWASNFHL